MAGNITVMTGTLARVEPMQLNSTMLPNPGAMPPNPGNARWCPDHSRYECIGNRNRGRGICHGPAIRGTAHCKMHPGKTLAKLKAEGEARISAWSAMGDPNIDYRMALLGVLQMTWLRLAAYSELLRRQVAAEGAETGPVTIDQDGVPQDSSGLVGHRMSSSPAGLYATSEEVRALVSLEAAERDRVVKYSKVAHDMGISDRLTNLAERWGDVVAARITTLLEALDLTPEQSAKVPVLLNTHLGSIDVEALGASAIPNGNGSGGRGVRDGGGPTR